MQIQCELYLNPSFPSFSIILFLLLLNLLIHLLHLPYFYLSTSVNTRLKKTLTYIYSTPTLSTFPALNFLLPVLLLLHLFSLPLFHQTHSIYPIWSLYQNLYNQFFKWKFMKNFILKIPHTLLCTALLPHLSQCPLQPNISWHYTALFTKVHPN